MYTDVTARLELWIPMIVFVVLWVVMQWHGKLPSVESIQKCVSIVNSRGGNIIVLSFATIYFFRYSMYIFTDLLNMVKDKTITQDNAFALMAIQFITTSAFGGAMGALLKTMTGESSTARHTDSTLPGTSTTSTVSTVSNTVPDKMPTAKQSVVAEPTLVEANTTEEPPKTV